MQRPVVKNSLFKFMTVLRTEVWLSIAGATIATAFMLWFLDKFSPYSAQNNPHKYKSFRQNSKISFNAHNVWSLVKT